MLLLISLLLAFELACDSNADLKRERAYRAQRAKGDILIGAPSSWKAAEAMELKGWQGFEMAADEINATGGVLGRKIRLLKREDGGTVSSARVVAQELAENPDVIAVIGHLLSDITLSVSITYSYNGLLMLAPYTTAPELTHQKGFRYIFRNIPTDEEIGRQLALYAVQEGYRRVLTYFSNNSYGVNLANAFEKYSLKLGCSVLDRRSYDVTANAAFFKKDLYDWKKNYVFDAIFFAGSVPHGALFIREARAMDIEIPIFAASGMDSPLLFQIAESAAEGVVTQTAYNPGAPRPEAAKFNKAFAMRYGSVPDAYAAQTYDSLKLLAHALQKAGSSVPEKVAQALYDTKGWIGVTGSHTFDENGDVVQKFMDFQKVRNGKFEFLKVNLNNPAYREDEEWRKVYREVAPYRLLEH